MSQSTLATPNPRAEETETPLFPLPVAAIEEMLLVDDRREYPMVCTKEVVLRGRLERELLQRAIQAAVARHPLLRAKIRRDPKLGLVWEPTSEQLEIDWADAKTPVAGLHDYVDLERESGLKFWIRQDADEVRLLLRIHHACCDGFGALQLVEDILAAYSAFHAGQTEMGWRELRPALLRRRGDFTALREEKAKNSLPLKRKLLDAFRFLTQSPSPLAAPKDSPSASQEFDGAICRDFGSDLLRALRRSAAKQHATLNDVLMRDLFLTLRDWNRQQGNGQGKWLRILMPCNLRDAELQAMPAANRMGYSFLTRSLTACEDPDSLLQGISDETKLVRERHRYLEWLRGLEITRSSRLAMAWMTRASRCFCTVVLSNLGDPSRAFAAESLRQRGEIQIGDATLKQFDAHSPLRPNTRGGFLVSTYANRLFISLSCDRHLFSPESAHSLLDQFGERLTTTAAR